MDRFIVGMDSHLRVVQNSSNQRQNDVDRRVSEVVRTVQSNWGCLARLLAWISSAIRCCWPFSSRSPVIRIEPPHEETARGQGQVVQVQQPQQVEPRNWNENLLDDISNDVMKKWKVSDSRLFFKDLFLFRLAKVKNLQDHISRRIKMYYWDFKERIERLDFPNHLKKYKTISDWIVKKAEDYGVSREEVHSVLIEVQAIEQELRLIH